MRIIIPVLITTIILGVFSCTKNPDPNPYISPPAEDDFIIFGNIYGACTGDCRTLYLLTESKLYRDSDEVTERLVYTFNPDNLPDSSFKVAEALWDIPLSAVRQETPEEALVQQIADFDYHISGRINGQEWMLRYDIIDSTITPDLYHYSKVLEEVIDEVR